MDEPEKQGQIEAPDNAAGEEAPQTPKSGPGRKIVEFASQVGSSLVLGFKVLAGECRWLVRKSLHAFETRQLKKRLDQEHLDLGRAVAGQMKDFVPGPEEVTLKLDQDLDLSLRQILFLNEEISHLDSEGRSMRSEFTAKRKHDLGLDQNDNQPK